MRTDKVHQEGSEPEPRERTGPRHAAPKKPLFTRLQMPAGKAIALAAMPTAVLMGMGLTPTLASAKPMPKNPFQDGPCVTQPDDAHGDSKKSDKADKPDASKSDKQDDADKASPSATPKPSSAPQRSPSGGSSSSGDRSPSPSPSASGSAGSGGLLGDLGGVLGGVLSPGQKATAKSSPSPSPSASAKDSGDEDSPAGKVAGAVGDTVDKVTGTAEDAGKAVGDAAGKAKDATKPSPSASATDDSGKKAFPCVEEKKSKGSDETPPTMIPNQPWFLEASSLLLQGLDYQGVVNLRMPNGQTKQALKFVASKGIDIGDLHQIVDGPMGKKYHVRAAPGSTSTIRGGTVTMYTESLEGNLFGVIPIRFDPEHPPPINLPTAFFTNVKIKQAGQFGGNLTIPGLHNTIED